jgi:acyl-homoserine-lactone acylase
MLLQNPHLLWGDFNLFYETQLISPDYYASGASLVGFPVLTYSFSDYLGWAHTVNVFDGVDHYELTLEDAGYRWDGGVRAFENETVALKVRQPDGTLREAPPHPALHPWPCGRSQGKQGAGIMGGWP